MKTLNIYAISDFKFLPPKPRLINIFDYLRCGSSSLVIALESGEVIEYDAELMEELKFESIDKYFKHIGLIQREGVLPEGATLDKRWLKQAKVNTEKSQFVKDIFKQNFNMDIDVNNIYIFNH